MRISESHFYVGGTRDSDWSEACLDPPAPAGGDPQQARVGSPTPAGATPFLHPHTHVKPRKHTTKMFAVAAQTTVRATAQVKATKVAAKEQKSS